MVSLVGYVQDRSSAREGGSRTEVLGQGSRARADIVLVASSSRRQPLSFRTHVPRSTCLVQPRPHRGVKCWLAFPEDESMSGDCRAHWPTPREECPRELGASTRDLKRASAFLAGAAQAARLKRERPASVKRHMLLLCLASCCRPQFSHMLCDYDILFRSFISILCETRHTDFC